MARTKTSDATMDELGAQLNNGSTMHTRVIERAREAFDDGIERTRNFEEALAQVMWEGYELGKHAAPKRKSRAKAKPKADEERIVD